MLPTFDKKPVYVLDLSIVRALPRDSMLLPSGINYVVPDALFLEICTTDSDKVLHQVSRAQLFLTLNQDRILFPKYWQNISNQERPGYPTNPIGTIEWAFTQDLRNYSPDSPNDFVECFPSLNRELDRHRDEKANFEEFIVGVSDFLKAQEGCTSKFCNDMCGSLELRTEFIRQPGLLQFWLTDSNQRYREPEWQKELLVYPDVHAFGKWLRLMTWYSVMHAIGKAGYTKDFSNNFEDAHYVLTASYFDGLVSQDRGQREASAAIFPDTCVLSSIEELANHIAA